MFQGHRYFFLYRRFCPESTPYLQYTGSGKRLKVMSDDGSHFTVEGGQLAMRPLFDRLCADFPFARVPSAHLPE